ncbi:MAG TPA: 6-phosphogluconolactonase [Thermoanaerobaculaceae bacterium]|nr:6-phosphogluconolactonase [Thermoanaerobaculaceae bacterium]HPS78195.1 6-phosphogluconolactonase [Thermoanaerobaculaceae bacterium]
MSGELRVFPDAAALARGAADELRRRATAAVAATGRFSVALSGGGTPRLLYRELAGDAGRGLPWDRTHVFWGDERLVPPEHPDSNYGEVWRELLGKVPIPPGNIHRMRGEDPDPTCAAADYDGELRRVFDLGPAERPRIDLVLLGMGADGHTASLFPGSAALDTRDRLVASTFVPRLGAWRLTLALPVLNAAACVLFLVSGADKAETLARVLEGPSLPRELPAQAVQPASDDLLWLVDAAAARALRFTARRNGGDPRGV